MGIAGIQLALNDIAPSHNVLGMLNAVALSLVSGIRAVAPALFASLYAFGVRNRILWGYFAWVVLAILAALLPVALMWMPAKSYGGRKAAKAAELDESDEQ